MSKLPQKETYYLEKYEKTLKQVADFEVEIAVMEELKNRNGEDMIIGRKELKNGATEEVKIKDILDEYKEKLQGANIRLKVIEDLCLKK